ncbi:hypothetical protein PF005_g13889 [Phytophthora fragariae]|uniref:Uncharacterized protein n=1 Tax=Phytophthora fragariae TaxID=53985 RepID=A0A6A3QKE6_9STRA|nr:hypothetical protein PF003_g39872 [Phytophthora fragariae]KAE8926252.1 hypothetical protein PF009_g23559 [Phytophthora fragariae]KAE9077962.1 hypothetical protein PF006_g27811 [Phytophthora fragariae]KAE9081114.1 hypothetical protein PF010_g22116 [Phytophthora fragariae]KAE9081880.1 hypothetical protein PF007_g22497 [Phytophthora fragariae]
MQGPAAFSFSIFLGLTPCGSQLDLQLPWSPDPNVHLNTPPSKRTLRTSLMHFLQAGRFLS